MGKTIRKRATKKTGKVCHDIPSYKRASTTVKKHKRRAPKK